MATRTARVSHRGVAEEPRGQASLILLSIAVFVAACALATVIAVLNRPYSDLVNGWLRAKGRSRAAWCSRVGSC